MRILTEVQAEGMPLMLPMRKPRNIDLDVFTRVCAESFWVAPKHLKGQKLSIIIRHGTKTKTNHENANSFAIHPSGTCLQHFNKL